MVEHTLYLPADEAAADKIAAIVDRAATLWEATTGRKADRLRMTMDLHTVHNTVGLRLDDMVGAEDFNLAHDVFGIERHLNRETAALEDSFVPRFRRRDTDA